MRFPDDVPTLTDGTVRLRAHRGDDVEAVYEQCQDPLTQRWTTVPVPYSRDDAERFVGQAAPAGWRHDTEWLFAVEAPGDDGAPRFSGSVSLRNEGSARAELAYGAHPWARGRGVMERALRLLLAWGFAERRLQTVAWWANRGNWASRKLAWRLGFSMDGTLRHWLPQRGELRDSWVGVLLRGEELSPRHRWYDVPRIAGESVVLRAHREQDLPRIVEACADERTRYWFESMPDPYTLADAAEYVAGRLEQLAAGAGITWVVADPATDELLANISVFDVRPEREGTIGYWAHPDARGRGVTTAACGLVVRHALLPEEDGGLGLRRVTVDAAEGNTASIRVIEANGFVHTSRRRLATRLRDGRFVDTLCYDLLLEEYVGPTASARP
jgi:RimJ/RimL family protein N-acetyltransferase